MYSRVAHHAELRSKLHTRMGKRVTRSKTLESMGNFSAPEIGNATNVSTRTKNCEPVRAYSKQRCFQSSVFSAGRLDPSPRISSFMKWISKDSSCSAPEWDEFQLRQRYRP